VLGFVSLFAAHAGAQVSADAAIEQYLQSRHLTTLEAAQLEDRLKRTPARLRGPIAQRLSAIYVALIQASDDPSDRQRWESQATGLLSLTPEATSIELRLNLSRVKYTQAEKTIERARLRLVDAGQRAEALSELDDLAPVFRKIAGNASQDVLAIGRQEESGRPYDPHLLATALRDARRRRSLGFYLAGWSNTYLAEMKSAPARAREAIVQFGWILGAQIDEPPILDKVPAKSLRYEHVARSAIGVAVDYAVLGDGASASAWLDLVDDSDETPESVRSQILDRRLTILARLNQWADLEKAVERSRRRSNGAIEPMPSGRARLVAVLALDSDTKRDEDIRSRLAQLAIADLVQERQLSQVIDLATRFGTASIVDAGFIGAHVRGLIAYQSANKKHDAGDASADSPTPDPAVARAYLDAAKLLKTALASPDAGLYKTAKAATAMFLGLSLYYASAIEPANLTDAVDAFEQSAELSSDQARAADALWMAHRAAMRLPATSSAKENSRAASIAQQFNKRFPDDPRASVLRVQLASSGQMAPQDAVAILLETPRSSPAYEESQRHASRLLYDLYRSAPADHRDWSALRYAAVAEPILAMDRARAQSGDAPSAQLAVVRARRLLDALLGVRAPDATRAQSALEALNAVIKTGLVVSPPAADELLFRQMQIALARGDEAAAASASAQLRTKVNSDAGPNRYIEYADRALFNFAALKWQSRRQSAPSSDLTASAREVVSRGAQLLLDLGADASNKTTAGALTIQAIIAHASFDLWRATGDSAALELSYRRHRLVIEASPNDRGALRRLADLAEAKHDAPTALMCWRRLSSGLPANTEPWFEAKVRLLELLATQDPPRAREALKQYITLRSDLGPEPWRSRLAALMTKLGVDDSAPDRAPTTESESVEQGVGR